jgi:hypothetical protein
MTTNSPDPNEAGRNWASPEIAEHWRRIKPDATNTSGRRQK